MSSTFVSFNNILKFLWKGFLALLFTTMTLVQKSVKGITFTVNHNTYTAVHVHSGIMDYDGIDG